jgi:hypothetical protein
MIIVSHKVRDGRLRRRQLNLKTRHVYLPMIGYTTSFSFYRLIFTDLPVELRPFFPEFPADTADPV